MQHNSHRPPQPNDSAAAENNAETTTQNAIELPGNEKLEQSEHSQADLSAKKTNSKKGISGGVLQLSQIVGMNGTYLTRTLAMLAARRGKQAAYAETSNEDREKEATLLAKDPKGASRLRIILVTGLQQGAKKQAMHPFWGDILDVVEQYLRRISLPLAVSLAIRQASLNPGDYRNLWLSITNRDKSQKILLPKDWLAVQEILVLDVFYAYWKDRIASEAVVEALAAFELDDATNIPQRLHLPWRPAVALATALPAPIVVGQADSIHNALTTFKHALLIANTRIENLVNELSQLTQQFKETNESLEQKSTLLDTANHNITQLQADVLSAGAIHKHKADELRSRYKGILEGDIDRHLRTIQLAADMNPPRGNVIIERVETLLGTLTRELKWLEDTE
jgi:hypothetical protein